MSALAKLCISKGYTVSGTDDMQSAMLDTLRSLGAQICIGPNKNEVKTSDLIVYTTAVGEHPDLLLAKSLNKTIYERADFLAEIASQYECVIAIAGTHGKTTTTSLVGHILKNAGFNPTIHTGGKSINLNSNLYVGGEKYFVTEACEFNKSFLALHPNYSIILNIEPEHLDTYKNFDEIKSAFARFCDLTKSKIIINSSEVGKISVMQNDNKQCTFGFDNGAELFAKSVKVCKGIYSFDCIYKGKKLFRVTNKILGKHNILNTLASIAVCLEIGVPKAKIKAGIESFLGVERRLQLLKQDKMIYYFDYAHHPTEIQATIQTLKEICSGKLIVVFQPHTYSRTLSLKNEFANCFDGADYIYILPTYSAREKFILGGDATDLVFYISQNISRQYVTNYESLKFELKQKLTDNDLCVFMGAGDIFDIAKHFIKDL